MALLWRISSAALSGFSQVSASGVYRWREPRKSRNDTKEDRVRLESQRAGRFYGFSFSYSLRNSSLLSGSEGVIPALSNLGRTLRLRCHSSAETLPFLSLSRNEKAAWAGDLAPLDVGLEPAALEPRGLPRAAFRGRGKFGVHRRCPGRTKDLPLRKPGKQQKNGRIASPPGLHWWRLRQAGFTTQFSRPSRDCAGSPSIVPQR